MKERIIERTSSVCPECNRQLDAVIMDDNGSVYLKKHCAEHGYFKALISKYAWYYEGLNRFYNKVAIDKHCFGTDSISDYQLFPRINSNLGYDIFFSDGSDTAADFSLEEIKKFVKNIKLPGRIVMLGGEPTTRPDLPEIIEIIARQGHRPWLYSNGYKLDDLTYLKKLRDSGLFFLLLWVDTLTDDGVYEKIRGREFLSEKKKILDNLKKLNMPAGIIVTVIRDINEGQIKDIVDFSIQNRFVNIVVIKTYSHVGRKKFSPQAEFPIDELVELVSQETGLISLEEFYVFQKLLYALFCFTKKPLCYLKQFIYLPRQKGKRLSEVIDLKRFEIHLDRFADIYQENRLQAKIYFMKEIFKRCIRNPRFLFLLGWQKSSWCRDYFLRLDISGYYTGFSYDKEKIKNRCNDIWLPSLSQDMPVDFCTMLINSFKT